MPDEDIKINVDNQNESSGSSPVPPTPPQPEPTILPEQPAETESVMEVPPQVPQSQAPEPQAPLQTTPSPPVKKSGSFLKVILGIVAFLALIGIGIWAYLNFVVAPEKEEDIDVTIPPVVTTPQSTMSVFSIDKELTEMENELTDLENELETEFDLDIEIPEF